MTEAEQIIEETARRGVLLTIGERSDRLDFDAPSGAMTAELRARVAAHKADVIAVLYDREERAAIQDAPEWADASMWHRGTTHPATLALLSKFARLGLKIVRVTPARKRENEAL
jgi:hypothetical protein